MAQKEKPLTDGMKEVLRMAEPALYGDIKVAMQSRSIAGMRKRGLVEGEFPHAYVTEAGKAELEGLSND